MSGDRDRCLECGCDDYASKPIGRDKLLKVVSKWCSPVSEALETIG